MAEKQGLQSTYAEINVLKTIRLRTQNLLALSVFSVGNEEKTWKLLCSPKLFPPPASKKDKRLKDVQENKNPKPLPRARESFGKLICPSKNIVYSTSYIFLEHGHIERISISTLHARQSFKHFSSWPEETGFIGFLSSLKPKADWDNGAKLLHGLQIPLGPEDTVSFSLALTPQCNHVRGRTSAWDLRPCGHRTAAGLGLASGILRGPYNSTSLLWQWGISVVQISVNLGHATEILRWLLKPTSPSLNGIGIAGWTQIYSNKKNYSRNMYAILKIRNEPRGRFEFTVHLHLSYNKKHSIKYKILLIIAILHILTCKCADKPNPHCLLSFPSKRKAGACHCAMHWGNAPQPCIMPLARAGRQPSYSEKNPPHLAFKSCVLTESFHKYWNISQYEQTRQDCTQVRAPSCITCCSGPLFFPRPCWPSRCHT